MPANVDEDLARARQRRADLALTLLAAELAGSLFILSPLSVLAPPSGLVLPLVVTALVLAPTFLAAVIVASSHGAARSAVLGAIALLATGMAIGLRGPSVLVTSLHLVGSLVLGAALMAVVAGAVFAPGRITYHRIVGTLLLYLLIGTTFAGLYGTLALLVPHPFQGMPPRQDGPALIAHAIYFSFATLTTVGYGDVIPMHPLSRGLSNLEAVIGQLFPATVIARMVTLELAGRGWEEPTSP
jgi:hypothetical protein